MDSIVFLPFLFGLLYLGLIVYVLILAARLVGATERIARALEARVPPAGGQVPVDAE